MVNRNKLGVWMYFVPILGAMQFEVRAIDVGSTNIECKGFCHVVPGIYDSRLKIDFLGPH